MKSIHAVVSTATSNAYCAICFSSPSLRSVTTTARASDRRPADTRASLVRRRSKTESSIRKRNLTRQSKWVADHSSQSFGNRDVFWESRSGEPDSLQFPTGMNEPYGATCLRARRCKGPQARPARMGASQNSPQSRIVGGVGVAGWFNAILFGGPHKAAYSGDSILSRDNDRRREICRSPLTKADSF
jgi:hypothetical protein